MTPQYVLRKSLCRPVESYTVRQAEQEIDNLLYSHDYAEPGYETLKRGILFANWNLFCAKAVTLCERMGFEIEWSDEWTTCSDCDKAVRTSPDSAYWTPSYVITKDGDFWCKECNDHDAP